MIDPHQLIFWILASVALLSALGVILSRNPVNSVLSLILTFFAISGFYFLLNAQFLAIVNIIVYAGAIMVLFLFVIMLMNLNAGSVPSKRILLKLAGVVSGGLLLLLLVAALHRTGTRMLGSGFSDIGLIKTLGYTLFHDFVVPFEASSILFLSAMVGAIVIGKKEG